MLVAPLRWVCSWAARTGYPLSNALGPVALRVLEHAVAGVARQVQVRGVGGAARGRGDVRVAGDQAVQGKGATCSMVRMQPYSQVYTGDSPIGSG